MSAHTGLGALEVAVLTAVAQVAGDPDADRQVSTRVLDVLDRDHGLGPRYGYPMLTEMTASWRFHLPLLDGEGNFGSQHGDPPADSQYTEVRLSAVGALALAAEREQVGPVPLGLIEGSLYRGGVIPPFDPARVLRGLTGGDLDAGRPRMPTGGTVEGDLEGLMAGRRARLRLGSTVVEEPGQLVISEIPFGVTIDEVERQLDNRIRISNDPDNRDYVRLKLERGGPYMPHGVLHVRNESSGRGIRVVIAVGPEVDAEEVRSWVGSVWPASVDVDWQLPAPMRERLKSWDAGDGSGLHRLSELI